jgi:hypothetical protein
MRRLNVFLCHAPEDKPAIRNLYQQLQSDGFVPWMEEEDLLPGQNWEQAISLAVRRSDAFIACLSPSFVTQINHGHKEIKLALDVADMQPEGAIFVIPARLEQCEVSERLRHLHQVNLFEEHGYKQLKRALQNRAESVGAIIGLHPAVSEQCYETLLKCQEFESDPSLQAIFDHPELKSYRSLLPYGAPGKRERIVRTIDYLLEQQLDDGQSVLLLFLVALRDRYNANDQLCAELEQCLHCVTDYLRREHQDMLPNVMPPYHAPGAFWLSFTNRNEEKAAIRKHLHTGEYVQVIAPSGLGKTYLLREVQREVKQEGARTVWLDFAQQHARCRADRFALLEEIASQSQTSGKSSTAIAVHNEDDALFQLGMELEQAGTMVVVFFDNADQASWRLLEWIRRTLLPQLSHRQSLRVIASSQQKIMEWQGYSIPGQPFRKLSLSGFDETMALREIIRGVGVINTNDQDAGLDDLIRSLYTITRGHPRAIERVLYHLVESKSDISVSSLQERYADLCERCLSPIVYGHILTVLSDDVQRAFSSLCVFRYVWLGLIASLTNRNVPDDLGGPWEPFSNRGNMEYWWRTIQRIPLIYDVSPRQMVPLSPIVRQLVAQVLQYENSMLYCARNRRARREYEHLLEQTNALPTQRAAWFIEVLYHMTQDGSLRNCDAAAEIEHVVRAFLNHPITVETWMATVPQLFNWMREDTELREVINRSARQELYDNLLEIVENYIHERQEDTS